MYIYGWGRLQKGNDDPNEYTPLVRVVEGTCRPVNTTYLPPILSAVAINLYTILPCTILHGVWQTNGGSEGHQDLRNSIAIVLQP